MSETKRPTSGMWVKCTKDYGAIDTPVKEKPYIVCAKGEWYQIDTAGKTTFSVIRNGGTSHFVWDTQHFDTTTARLKPPAAMPDIKVEPAKRKLEAGMWVRCRQTVIPEFEVDRWYYVRRYSSFTEPCVEIMTVDGYVHQVPDSMFDLDNPLTAEEVAAAVATRIEPTVINSVEEAKHGYRSFPAYENPPPMPKCACGFPHCCECHPELHERKGNVLQQADKLIYGDRQKAYGSVSTNFTNIAKGWSVILGTGVSAEQVGLCMAWLKIARQVNKPNIDNLIDAAGYVGCVEKVQKGL